MRTPAYWKTAILPAANLTSSRRACLPGSLGSRSSSGPVTGGFTGFGGFLYLVYQEEVRLRRLKCLRFRDEQARIEPKGPRIAPYETGIRGVPGIQQDIELGWSDDRGNSNG